VRPRILLDACGVLLDTITPILDIFNAKAIERFGSEWRPRTVDEIRHYYVHESLGLDREFDKEVWSSIGTGWCRSLKPYPGAVTGVRLLREAGDVFFVTKPLESCPTWASERAKSLAEHFGATGDEIVSTAAKHTVAGDILVDDHKKNLDAWAKHFPFGIPIRWLRCKFEDYYSGPETNRWGDVLRWAYDRNRFLGNNPRYWTPQPQVYDER